MYVATLIILVYTHFKSILMTKRKKYQITHKLLAKWFGYSSERSFNSSTAKEQMTRGIDKVIQHIENQIIKDLNK